MLIVCPSCSSRYEIDAAKLGTDGRKVRCPSCSFEWHAHGEGKAPVAFAAEEADPFPPSSATEAFIEDEWKRAAELDENVSLVVAELDGTPQAFDPSATDLPNTLEQDQPPVMAMEAEAEEEPKPRPAARKAKAKPASVPMSARFAGFGRALVSPVALACAGVMAIGLGVWKREAVVRAAPAMAIVFEKAGMPVNLRGLTLASITTGLTQEGQGAFLVVEGEVSNIMRDAAKLPLIEIVIQDEAGKPLYTWTTEPPRASLNAGDKARFRARLAAPPQNGQSVVVRFAKGGTKLAAAAR
ncbi:MAG: zinc-ribbon domain-containing protein [Bosea sp. (in: a-proteobacteria)]